jgi:hypothetical protein
MLAFRGRDELAAVKLRYCEYGQREIGEEIARGSFSTALTRAGIARSASVASSSVMRGGLCQTSNLDQEEELDKEWVIERVPAGIANRDEGQFILRHVEIVNDPVVAQTEAEFASSGHAVVREGIEAASQVANFRHD